MWRALKVQQNMWFLRDSHLQLANEARLADARRARQQNDFALAILGVLPALGQEGELALAPDHRCQGARVRRLQPGRHCPVNRLGKIGPC